MKDSLTLKILLGVVVLVNALGLFPELIMGDSALYAQTAKSMVETGDYMNLYRNGIDWLDKPHFQFWFSAFIMKLFGTTHFAFKLASFVFYLLALFYTFKISLKFYNRDTAWFSTLILASSLHVIISNSDVRAETILMAAVIAAVYYLSEFIESYSWKDSILIAIFCAIAILTKGLFTLIPIVFAFLGLAWRSWNDIKILHWKWLFIVLLTLTLITPELYSLYVQFDLHPEKIVYGNTNVSGIQFFLWDSQFGRFVNTGPIKGTGYSLFFVEVMMWAFAPWGFIFITSVFTRLKKIRKNQNLELFSLSGFFVLFIIFSISKFQLSHYLNIIFPFAAILTADYMLSYTSKAHKRWISFNVWFFAVFVKVAVLAFVFIARIPIVIPLLLLALTFTVLVLFVIYTKDYIVRLLGVGVLAACLMGLFLNLSYYPFLFSYQSGSRAAIMMNNSYPNEEVILGTNSFLLEFYYRGQSTHLDTSLSIIDQCGSKPIYGDYKFQKFLVRRELEYIRLDSFPHFHTTKMNGAFLDPVQRSSQLRYRYLFRLKE